MNNKLTKSLAILGISVLGIGISFGFHDVILENKIKGFEDSLVNENLLENVEDKNIDKLDITDEVSNNYENKENGISNKLENIEQEVEVINPGEIDLNSITINNKDVITNKPLNNGSKNESVYGKNNTYTYDAKKVWSAIKNNNFNTENDEKIVFLTFDDGPSTTVTPSILDVLDKYEIKATFFVLGSAVDKPAHKEILKRMYNSGHSIANHTYTHKYSILYPNRNLDLNAFVNEINKTDEAISNALGVDFKTSVVRCPGGYSSWNQMDGLMNYLNANNMATVDWTSLTGDAEGKNRSVSELINRFNETFRGKNIEVILMHDTYGKENTAKALENLILNLKEKGYVFKTLV